MKFTALLATLASATLALAEEQFYLTTDSAGSDVIVLYDATTTWTEEVVVISVTGTDDPLAPPTAVASSTAIPVETVTSVVYDTDATGPATIVQVVTVTPTY